MHACVLSAVHECGMLPLSVFAWKQQSFSAAAAAAAAALLLLLLLLLSYCAGYSWW
jgi:ABC-type phosphate transport system permease subunit